jgi:histidinol-phosphatase (PHP family)
MKYSCLHTHTTFCDGRDSVEAMCQYAWKRGFVSLGFSAHAPLPADFGPETEWHLHWDRLTEYVDAVQDAKRRWQGKLQVFLGLEVDYIRNVCGPSDGRFTNLGLDYRIGSVHYLVPHGDIPFTVDGSLEELIHGIEGGYGGSANRMVEAFWTATEEMVGLHGFDILGHLDLVKKNNRDRPLFSPAKGVYTEGADRVIQAIEAKMMVVEVNTGGMNRGTVDEPYPSVELIKKLRSRSIPMTINADAHRTEHLGGHYEEARTALLRGGYDSMVLFAGKEGGLPRWEEEPL